MPPSTYPTYGLPLLQRPNDDLPYTPDTASYSPTPGGQFIGKPAVHSPIGPRTPSPTPSESKALKAGVLDWKSLVNWRFWFRKEWIWYYVALVVILVITALVTLYHTQIVDWLTPVTKWLHDLKFGWLVPIGVLFVISFPPLFGHEIVAILCGLVWGLWIGFGIVAAGTFIGEVGNFYAFKYCCRARGEKLEKTKISYACLAKVVRDGGFKIALIARLSAIPGHFTTAVFSTCGMGIITFSIAAILSMPKQFITVYLGVILEQSNAGVQDPKSRIISDVVLVVTFIITIVAMWYILHRMNKVKPAVIYERRKARQAKLDRADHSLYSTPSLSGTTAAAFTPHASHSSIDTITSAATPKRPWHADTDMEAEAGGYEHEHDLATPHTAQPIYAPQPQPRPWAGGQYSGRYAQSEEEFEMEYPRDGGYGREYGYGHLSGSGKGAGNGSEEEVGWELGTPHTQRHESPRPGAYPVGSAPPWGGAHATSTAAPNQQGPSASSLSSLSSRHRVQSSPQPETTTPTQPRFAVPPPVTAAYTLPFDNLQPVAPRGFSPPPPSYRTDLR